MGSRPPSMQPFLEKVLHLQIFEQFITDRLDSLNSGNGFSDEFEQEANLWADKLNSNSKYREWLKVREEEGVYEDVMIYQGGHSPGNQEIQGKVREISWKTVNVRGKSGKHEIVLENVGTTSFISIFRQRIRVINVTFCFTADK